MIAAMCESVYLPDRTAILAVKIANIANIANFFHTPPLATLGPPGKNQFCPKTIRTLEIRCAWDEGNPPNRRTHVTSPDLSTFV
jgi:hypothetical protein